MCFDYFLPITIGTATAGITAATGVIVGTAGAREGIIIATSAGRTTGVPPKDIAKNAIDNIENNHRHTKNEEGIKSSVVILLVLGCGSGGRSQAFSGECYIVFFRGFGN